MWKEICAATQLKCLDLVIIVLILYGIKDPGIPAKLVSIARPGSGNLLLDPVQYYPREILKCEILLDSKMTRVPARVWRAKKPFVTLLTTLISDPQHKVTYSQYQVSGIKTTMACAGAMPYCRDFPSTARV